MYRAVMWGMLVLVVVVPLWLWLVRTNHELVDVAFSAVASLSLRVCSLLVVLWQRVAHLAGAPSMPLPLLVSVVGVVGAAAGGAPIAAMGALVVRGATAVRGAARAAGPRVPWLVLALLGVFAHVASSLRVGPAPPVARSLLPRPSCTALSARLPSVVNCSYTAACLNGDTSWAKELTCGEWVVDSGAELMIAGKFMYPFSTVVLRGPDVRIRGVDG